MGFRSPSISTAAIFLYQEAARFLLMFRCRLTGSSSSMLGRSDSRSKQVLEGTGKESLWPNMETIKSFERLLWKYVTETMWTFFLCSTDLDSLSCVSSTSILSTTAGSGHPSTGSREKLLPTVIRPRSITSAFWEVEDWGTTMSGAFSLTSIDRRKLFLAKSRTLEAAFSAAWAVAALRASFAVWKLLLKFWNK